MKAKTKKVPNSVWYVRLRIALSVLVLVIFVGAFFQVGQLALAGRGEFGPALLRSMARNSMWSMGAAGVILILTLIFGRVYCAFMCPLGIFQDLIWCFRNLLVPKRWRRSPVLDDLPYVRYGVLTGAVTCLAFGGGWLLGLMEPFSFFGRIANGIIAPALVGINNFFYRNFDALNLSPMAHKPFDMWLLLMISFCTLLLIAAVVLFNRGFCNTLCPVGAVLGLFSRKAWFKFRVSDRCTRCGMCVRECKGGCINLKDEVVDNERCVMCGNCLKACRFGAIRYEHAGTECSGKTLQPDSSRREFFGSMTLAALPGAVLGRTVHRLNGTGKAVPIMPPGATNLKKFTGRCTGCHLCVANCKGNVLKGAWNEYGLAGVGQVHLDFSQGMCEFECNNCSKFCPTGALERLSVAEKRRRRIGEVRYVKDLCIVVRDQCDCGACAEHCPTGALKMIPYGNNLRIPMVVPELCIGCGSCEYICPARPVKAITVEGVVAQSVAADPKKFAAPVKKKVEIDEFPF